MMSMFQAIIYMMIIYWMQSTAIQESSSQLNQVHHDFAGDTRDIIYCVSIAWLYWIDFDEDAAGKVWKTSLPGANRCCENTWFRGDLGGGNIVRLHLL